MKIGGIIKRMRELRSMTQQELGEYVGFPARNAATRIAQYETNYRIPKKNMAEKIASAIGISPFALSEPSFDDYYSLYHALMILEDMYDSKPVVIDGKAAIAFGNALNDQKSINKFIRRWQEMNQSYYDSEITKDEYDEWRYSYPIVEAGMQKASRKKK